MSAVQVHQIVVYFGRRGLETYSCGGLSATHRTDALRTLLRYMVMAGMSGPAEVRGEDGKLRLIVADVKAASGYVLSEEDRDGFRLRPYSPDLPGRRPASGFSTSSGSAAPPRA